MEENIRKYVNKHRVQFLKYLPTELFAEGFPGLLSYKRNQIKTVLRSRGEFDANSDLLDAILKTDDFPDKFIAFCEKHECCLDLAMGIKRVKLRGRSARGCRRNESSCSTSLVSNVQNAEGRTSLQNDGAGESLQIAESRTSLQNVSLSNNENYEQSMNIPPSQSSESQNHQQKDESLHISSGSEENISQNNVSKSFISPSQNVYDNIGVGACQIFSSDLDENIEGLNTSSFDSSSFMLSDSDLENCNPTSMHEITNLKLNVYEEESKTFVQPRKHLLSSLSQISIENNEEVSPSIENNHLGPIVDQVIKADQAAKKKSTAGLSNHSKSTLKHVDNQGICLTTLQADTVPAAQWPSMDKSSVMIAASSDDWNYVSTQINSRSLGEPNVPETKEDFQNFEISQFVCLERTNILKGVQCQEDLQNHKLLLVTDYANSGYTGLNENGLETSEESSNTEVKEFFPIQVNNHSYMEPTDKQSGRSDVKNNSAYETRETENFNARSRESYQDSSNRSFVHGFSGLTDHQVKDGNGAMDHQLKDSNAEIDHKLKNGNDETDHQVKDGNGETDHELKDGNSETDHELKDGNSETDHQLNDSNDEKDQVKDGNGETDHELKDGNSETDHQLNDGNGETDHQLKDGNGETDHQLKDGNGETDHQLKYGNGETDHQVKEGNGEMDHQLKEYKGETKHQVKDGNGETDHRVKEGNIQTDHQLEVVFGSEHTITNSKLRSNENLLQENGENNSQETNLNELRQQLFFSQVLDNTQQPAYVSLSGVLCHLKSIFTSLFFPQADSEVDPPHYLTDNTH